MWAITWPAFPTTTAEAEAAASKTALILACSRTLEELRN
jgi:hypothetical protein